MKSRVQPLRKTIPEEFSPKRRLTSKKFTFSQPVPRAKSVAQKTFEDPNSPPKDETETTNGEPVTSEDQQQQQLQHNEEEQESEVVKSRELPPNNENNQVNADKEADANQNNESNTNHEEMPNSAHSNHSQRSTSAKSQKPKATVLDDEEMISLRNELMTSRDFSNIDEETLDNFVQYMKEYTMYTASQADYEEAKRAKSLGDDAAYALYHKKNDREKSDEEKQMFLKAKQQNEEKWQSEVDMFDLETNEKLEQLKQRQEDEKNSFDQFWSEEKTLRKYRKPSARLLELWRMEKFLAKQNNFDEAKIVRAESEELSKRELAMGQALANRDYHSEKEKLTERQETEITELLQNREHWRDVLLSRQKIEKSHFYNRSSVVTVRQSEPLRTREAQLPSKSNNNSKTRSIASNNNNNTSSPKASSKLPSADISFQYCTVLPPLVPPVSGESSPTHTQSECASQNGSRAKSQNCSGRSGSQKGSGKNSASVSSTG